MKKSKIIVPALGILAFSTAAAVTGTVAWFTANRTASISNTAITAFNPEAGLKITLANRAGKTAALDGVTVGGTPGEGTTPATATHELLRDGSVDFANSKVYRSVAKDDGSQPDAFALVDETTNGLLAGTNSASKKYYYASVYTATFSLSGSATPGDKTYAVYYDNSKLLCTDVDGKNAISPALRMGFVCPTASNNFVLVPFRAAAPTAGLKYISGETPAVTTYSGQALYGLTSAAWAGASPAPTANLSTITTDTVPSGSKVMPGYLGDISSSTTSFSITLFTWFEGTDDACINESVLDGNVITAKLGFKMVEVK